MKNLATQQIEQATFLGKKAFKAGIQRVPIYDHELSELYAKRNIGETPQDEAKTTDILSAWLLGWDLAWDANNVFNEEKILTE